MPVKEVPESTPEQVAAARAAAPATAEDALEAQRKEYGQYVAKEQIFAGSALVYNVGDPVPASNVEHHKYLDQGVVVKVGTKEHRDFENAHRAGLGLPPLQG